MLKKIAVALVAAGGLMVAAAPAHAGGHFSLSLGLPLPPLPGIYAAPEPAYYGPPPVVYDAPRVYEQAPVIYAAPRPYPYYGPRYYAPRVVYREGRYDRGGYYNRGGHDGRGGYDGHGGYGHR